PIPSRRLGISLGIDLVPHKICSFNCVYCECGKNTKLTTERKEYKPAQEILDEIADYLSKNPHPDFISLAGSGEPTLHSKIGLIINSIKISYPEIKIAVMTNSSLLPLAEVRSELMDSDIVLPSLDGATQDSFIHIDRPHPSIKLNDVINGIALFTKEFKSVSPDKKVWLEIFILENINDDSNNIIKLKEACQLINPDKIQLNSLDRPGTEKWVTQASKGTLYRVMKGLNMPQVEIISKFKNRSEIIAYRNDIENTILETISRRPSSSEDLCFILGLKKEELNKYIDILELEKKIKAEILINKNERNIFYKITN
ncbi:MAG: hypothetical protein A2355_16910, partial [Spirochaetes bacterium RIFOXYB1_FULL_32_8]